MYECWTLDRRVDSAPPVAPGPQGAIRAGADFRAEHREERGAGRAGRLRGQRRAVAQEAHGAPYTRPHRKGTHSM